MSARVRTTSKDVSWRHLWLNPSDTTRNTSRDLSSTQLTFIAKECAVLVNSFMSTSWPPLRVGSLRACPSKQKKVQVPQSFWSRLAGKYGNKFYWQQEGEHAAIMNAVSAINTCLREPAGRFQCSKVQGEFGEEEVSGMMGNFFK
jgi:hypothetical protein